jgi:hypothetical protein
VPIEIRELVIKVTVDESGPGEKGGAGKGAGGSERAGIISDCVDQVMQILRDNSER